MSHTPTIEVVAGAGGAKGPGLIGGFKALEDRGVAVGKITGVSVGSLMAAFYANGYTADELAEIFIREDLRLRISARLNSIAAWLNPINRVAGVVNLKPEFERLVERYQLKPRNNLRIVAYDVVRRRPVVFEGTRYDLATALAASCAIPFIMRPVLYRPGRTQKRFVSRIAAETMASPAILVDGGVQHMNPSTYCGGPAIVFTLGAVTRLPAELPRPVEAVFHMGELLAGGLLGVHSRENPRDVNIPVGSPDVGGVSFSTSQEKCRKMIRRGYKIAAAALDEAVRNGRVPLLRSTAA